MFLGIALAILIGASSVSQARACPNCKEAVNSSEGEVSSASMGYNWSVAFMLCRSVLDAGNGHVDCPSRRQAGRASGDVTFVSRFRRIAHTTRDGFDVVFAQRAAWAVSRRRPAVVLAARSSIMSMDGLLDGGLPVVAESVRISRSLVGERDSARVVDERTQSIGIECTGDVARGRALAAVAGNEQGHAGKCLAQFGELFGVSRTDDGPDEAIAALAAMRLGPLQEAIGDMPVEGLSVRPAGPGIRRRSCCWCGRGRRRPSSRGRRL